LRSPTPDELRDYKLAQAQVGGHAGGETAVICVSLSTVKEVAALAPNLTAVAPVKFLPVMTTVVPPSDGR
jgi:hypothetical protein